MECTVLTLSENTLLEFADNSNVSVVLFSVCRFRCEREVGVSVSFSTQIEACIRITGKLKLHFSGNSGCAPNENDWSCNYDSR